MLLFASVFHIYLWVFLWSPVGRFWYFGRTSFFNVSFPTTHKTWHVLFFSRLFTKPPSSNPSVTPPARFPNFESRILAAQSTKTQWETPPACTKNCWVDIRATFRVLVLPTLSSAHLISRTPILRSHPSHRWRKMGNVLVLVSVWVPHWAHPRHLYPNSRQYLSTSS